MRILQINPPFASAVIREGRCQSPQNMKKNSMPTISSDILFTKNLKERHPNLITVTFGTHVTALHKEVMDENLFLDVAIIKEKLDIVCCSLGLLILCVLSQ